MNVAYVTTYDPHDPGLWAGTGHHIGKALEAQGCKVTYLGPLQERCALPIKGAQFLSRKILGRELERDREPIILNGYAKQIRAKLKNSGAQVLLSAGAVAMAHLNANIPIAFWADATYAAVHREYRWEMPKLTRSIRLGHKMEREGLKRAALAIYSSDWAAQSAIHECGADPARVKVVPFGANVSVNHSPEQIRAIVHGRAHDKCNLLFVGTGWERKGGDVAVEVARRMNAMGMPTQITLVGKIPDEIAMLPYVRVAGFIDKKTDAGRAQFNRMFEASHFLIHPARAEASAIVLCEAGAYGVPTLATRVGGTPTLIRDNVNGLLFKPDDPLDMAERTIELFHDRNRYLDLALSSNLEHKARLNWEVAGRSVVNLLKELIA